MSPETLRVTLGAQARVRVEGQGRGVLRVGRQKRWVWGLFDESFVVRLPPDARSLAVVLRGLGGSARVDLACGPFSHLEVAAVSAQLPRLQVHVAVPATRGLRTHRIAAPRIVPLTRATVESARLEAEPNP